MRVSLRYVIDEQEDDKMALLKKLYPRTGDIQTIYLKNAITQHNIIVGDYTIYHDFVNDPQRFEQNNVL